MSAEPPPEVPPGMEKLPEPPTPKITPKDQQPPNSFVWWLSQAFTDFCNGFAGGLGAGVGVGGVVGVVANQTVEQPTSDSAAIGVLAMLASAAGNGLMYVKIFHHSHPFSNWFWMWWSARKKT